jgi:Flp pilus assembly protein TadD
MQAFAKNRQILLLRAVALEQAGRGAEAEPLLQQMQNRWPEWQAGWLAQGIVLGRHGRRSEARAALATALALGTLSPEVRRYLDEITAGREAQPPDLTSLLLSKPSPDQ